MNKRALGMGDWAWENRGGDKGTRRQGDIVPYSSLLIPNS